MNDKLVMETVLLLLKGKAEVYVHGSEEASNQKIHDAFIKALNETLELQYEVYQKMTEYNWYQVKNIDAKKIATSLQQLNSN